MIKSLQQNRTGILLILVSAICACTGQLLWKISAEGNIGLLLTGFVLYGIGALFMLIAYKFGSLSVLQPMLSVSYIFSIFLGRFILGETITIIKLIGIIVITGSVVLIGGGDN